MGRKGIIAVIVGAIIGAVIGYGVGQSALGSALGAVVGAGIVAVGLGLSALEHGHSGQGRRGAIMTGYREGPIYLDPQERYSLRELDVMSKPLPWDEQVHFTSGRRAEIEVAGQWIRGRFEHAQGGYYFLTKYNKAITLHDGIKARVRTFVVPYSVVLKD